MSLNHIIYSPIKGKIIKWIAKNNNKINKEEDIVIILTDLNENYILKSNYNGILKRKINKEDILIDINDIICEIFECSHPAIFKNLCVSCGMKINVADNKNNNNQNTSSSSSSSSSSLKTTSTTSSLPLSTIQHASKFTMIGGQTIRLSQLEAQQTQQNKMLTMKKNKKLSLILDLDSTLVHATPFQNYPQEILKNVKVIQLEENGYILRHLVKLRPHLEYFLASCKPYFQMTIYTHGTRSYAEATARVIDPDGQYFGKRIVSRTDHPDLGLEKCLSRLFLQDWSMAIVLDDRDDVWRKDQQTHVVCLKPYLYFHQLSINGLKPQQEINNAPGLSTTSSFGPSSSSTTTPPILTKQSPTQQLTTIPLDQSSSEKDSSSIITTTTKSESSLESNSTVSTPTSQLDEKDLSDSSNLPISVPISENNNNNNNNDNDNDNSLLKSLNSLLLVHSKYYELLEKGENPNVGEILSSMRKSILKGCNICFSDMNTTKNMNPRKHRLWIIAESLGANLSLDLTSNTTHLLTLSIETEKSRECIKLGNIYVLHPDWLLYCFWHIIKEDEHYYLLAPIINPPVLQLPDTNIKVNKEGEINENKKRSRDESETKSNRILQRSNAGVYGVNYNSSSESSDSSSDENEKPRKFQRMFTNEFKSNKNENYNNIDIDIQEDQEQEQEDKNSSNDSSSDVSNFKDDDDWLEDLENERTNNEDNEDNDNEREEYQDVNDDQYDLEDS